MPNNTRPASNSERTELVEGSNGRKLAEVIAERIEDEIIRLEWPVGTVIGSEADFLERFGVSRAVFREAVRIIENHRAARMRRGPNGGLVVTEPDVASIARTAALFLDSEEVTGRNLTVARTVIELAAVERATKELTDEGIVALNDVLAAERQAIDADDITSDVHDLHSRIAELSGNPALRLFIDVLIELTGSGPRTEVDHAIEGGAEPRYVAGMIHRAHEGIVEAMVRGDATLAVHRMRKHLQAMEPWLA